MASSADRAVATRPGFREVLSRYSGLATVVLPVLGLIIGLFFDEAVLGALCGAGISLVLTRQEILEQMRSINEASKIFDQVRECAVNTSAVVRIMETASQFERGSVGKLPMAFVDGQVEDLGTDLRSFLSGQLSRKGARWDWFESISEACATSIDAVSTPQADLELWSKNEDLDRAYLNNQERLVERGGKVRRIFILPNSVDPLTMRRVDKAMDEQKRKGIDVRYVPPSGGQGILDQVVFDEEVVVTTTFSADGVVATTQVSSVDDDVMMARKEFDKLWEVAEPFTDKGW